MFAPSAILEHVCRPAATLSDNRDTDPLFYVSICVISSFPFPECVYTTLLFFSCYRQTGWIFQIGSFEKRIHFKSNQIGRGRFRIVHRSYR